MDEAAGQVEVLLEVAGAEELAADPLARRQAHPLGVGRRVEQ